MGDGVYGKAPGTKRAEQTADIQGMLTQVHLSFRQTQPPSERVI